MLLAEKETDGLLDCNREWLKGKHTAPFCTLGLVSGGTEVGK